MTSTTVPLLDEDAMAFGEELNGNGGKITHPYVTFFHCVFRGLSVVVYMLCGLFGSSFITSFITIVLLLSLDFWTVKNITGRIMVGLRWWNYVDNEGKSHWMFEARKDQSKVNSRESRIFWTILILAPGLWMLFFIIAVFSLNLKWLLVVMIALILNFANFYGYFKCKVGTNTSIRSATTDFLQKQVLNSAVALAVNKTTSPQANAGNPTMSNII